MSAESSDPQRVLSPISTSSTVSVHSPLDDCDEGDETPWNETRRLRLEIEGWQRRTREQSDMYQEQFASAVSFLRNTITELEVSVKMKDRTIRRLLSEKNELRERLATLTRKTRKENDDTPVNVTVASMLRHVHGPTQDARGVL